MSRNLSNTLWRTHPLREEVPESRWRSTKDFRSFERYGVIMQPEDKDAALLPRRIGGRWALIHRPMTTLGAHMWISYSPDLRHWGSHKVILEARRGGWWDANKIGLCSPPIETAKGWLMIYHGVRQTASGSIYRLGLALFDLERPEICLQRGNSWLFGPEASYERSGDVKDVVFPCGQTIGADGDTIHLYYGAADSCVALATGSIRCLLSWLDANSSPAETSFYSLHYKSCETNNHEALFQELRDARLPVINEKSLPFPGSGRQTQFHDEFRKLPLLIYGRYWQNLSDTTTRKVQTGTPSGSFATCQRLLRRQRAIQDHASNPHPGL